MYGIFTYIFLHLPDFSKNIEPNVGPTYAVRPMVGLSLGYGVEKKSHVLRCLLDTRDPGAGKVG